ncbi:hypothetical protein CDAR_72751 [Caerostris darwini]|uniref:Uncharacterized protein n=1 Tax=Caerostris darwini TaxID=1538125 RepID=A0AAV4MK93_9ARAC|nr:hypothetical protein CDAR_72751 [Caerostris darwini]
MSINPFSERQRPSLIIHSLSLSSTNHHAHPPAPPAERFLNTTFQRSSAVKPELRGASADELALGWPPSVMAIDPSAPLG